MSFIFSEDASTPGLEYKFVLFPKKKVDSHQAVVQACIQIAHQHEMRQHVQDLEAQLGQMRAERFATECLKKWMNKKPTLFLIFFNFFIYQRN